MSILDFLYQLCLFIDELVLPEIFTWILCYYTIGDQVQRKGALTGGYIDKRISRLELQGSIKQLRSTLSKYEEEYDKLRQEITHIDNEHNNIMTELQREDMKSKKNW